MSDLEEKQRLKRIQSHRRSWSGKKFYIEARRDIQNRIANGTLSKCDLRQENKLDSRIKKYFDDSQSIGNQDGKQYKMTRKDGTIKILHYSVTTLSENFDNRKEEVDENKIIFEKNVIKLKDCVNKGIIDLNLDDRYVRQIPHDQINFHSEKHNSLCSFESLKSDKNKIKIDIPKRIEILNKIEDAMSIVNDSRLNDSRKYII